MPPALLAAEGIQTQFAVSTGPFFRRSHQILRAVDGVSLTLHEGKRRLPPKSPKHVGMSGIFAFWQGNTFFLCRECTLMVLDRNKKPF